MFKLWQPTANLILKRNSKRRLGYLLLFFSLPCIVVILRVQKLKQRIPSRCFWITEFSVVWVLRAIKCVHGLDFLKHAQNFLLPIKYLIKTLREKGFSLLFLSLPLFPIAGLGSSGLFWTRCRSWASHQFFGLPDGKQACNSQVGQSFPTVPTLRWVDFSSHNSPAGIHNRLT